MLSTVGRSGLRSTRAWQKRFSSSKIVPPHSEYRFRTSIERGRRQYAARNLATAVGLSAGVAGIYFYSMYAVKQEDYSDIPMPELPTEEEKEAFKASK